MKYIFLMENVVREIISEFDPIFPNIPITARYTAEFLAQCVTADDDADVELNDIYDPETGTFIRPQESEDPEDPEDSEDSEE